MNGLAGNPVTFIYFSKSQFSNVTPTPPQAVPRTCGSGQVSPRRARGPNGVRVASEAGKELKQIIRPAS